LAFSGNNQFSLPCPVFFQEREMALLGIIISPFRNLFLKEDIA
jgi:hypothetical protein